eukprot:2358693-Prymnesium_polylepis.1
MRPSHQAPDTDRRSRSKQREAAASQGVWSRSCRQESSRSSCSPTPASIDYSHLETAQAIP